MRRLNSLGLILTLCFCAGCFPIHNTTRPGVKGVVVDGHSGSPLPGATIQVAAIEGYWDKTNKAEVLQTNTLAITNCDLMGAFSISPQKKWGIYIVPMDYFESKFEVKIQCVNHQPERTNFWSGSMDTGKYATVNLGRVTLTPE